MPALTRRHLLAGAAATAACAAMPAAAIGAVVETPVVMEAGASLLYGSFEPVAIGVDGDTYIDIITDDVWQKASGAWRLVGNICGRESARCFACYDLCLRGGTCSLPVPGCTKRTRSPAKGGPDCGAPATAPSTKRGLAWTAKLFVMNRVNF